MDEHKNVTFGKDYVRISRYRAKIVINEYPTHKISLRSKSRLENLQFQHKIKAITLFDSNNMSGVFTVWHWQG